MEHHRQQKGQNRRDFRVSFHSVVSLCGASFHRSHFLFDLAPKPFSIGCITIPWCPTSEFGNRLTLELSNNPEKLTLFGRDWNRRRGFQRGFQTCTVDYWFGLRQDHLDLSFWSFLSFFHNGIENVERHLLWNFHEKIQKKSWSNMPLKLLACIRFLYKVVHKIGRLRKFNRAREIELNFLSFGISLWNLAHLFIILMATNECLTFLNFAQGLNYGLSKLKKNGVKSSLKFERS